MGFRLELQKCSKEKIDISLIFLPFVCLIGKYQHMDGGKQIYFGQDTYAQMEVLSTRLNSLQLTKVVQLHFI